jgi:hypothetical protein
MSADARTGASTPWRYGYLAPYEYKSTIAIAGWPLVHVCGGVDPVTLQPRIAKGVVAIGNVAVGVVAVGGVACGLVAIGGASIGLVLALGGAALGLGLSIGGAAVGSIAIGGAAVGFVYAIGGAAFGPAVVDAGGCNRAAVDFLQRWFGRIPPNCR